MIFNKKLTRQSQIGLFPQYLLVMLPVLRFAATAEDSVQQKQLQKKTAL